MEEGTLIRPSPLRPGGSSKSSSSGKLTPRGSPSFRRLNSERTPRREPKTFGLIGFHCFRSNRVVLWLLLITLWAYAAFYFQSRWAHGDNKENLFSGGYGGENERDLMANTNLGVARLQNNVDANLTKKVSDGVSLSKNTPLKKKSKRSTRMSRKRSLSKPKAVEDDSESEISVQMDEIPKQNTTHRSLVGPFGSVEDSVLGWGPEKRRGTCDRKGAFARLVWSRKFVLIFHELSMTGAPLSMMELATEFLSCGAAVSVIVLNRKGGLMMELVRRKIKVLEDKTDLSFKTAMKADLIIAGSAVCSNWIENYLSRTVLGSSQIMWWIMENRREYFNRTMPVLNRVKKLIFLSQSQSRQWLDWCQQENIELKSEPALVPLSVNDELSFTAGIPSSLNTPSFTTETMLEKKRLLRNAVRKEMGLAECDMLVITLSSINPGKGQLLLLDSIRLLMESGSSVDKSGSKDSIFLDKKDGGMGGIKILIGSVGSKSNKVLYVKTLLRYLAEHSNLSRSVLWTPATTRVASLYAAADVYVMNSQGLGETFGRVTIEAMAFGLPVLGTGLGGTKEIVEHNVTGLLHPPGRPGAQILAENVKFLLRNPSARQEMGARGRAKVEKMYLKKHMFQKFGEVLYNCMRIK